MSVAHALLELPRSPARTVTPRPTTPDVGRDVDITGALISLLHDRRLEAASRVAEGLREAGVDNTNVAFVEDDLRELTEALTDLEVYVQECVESLLDPQPGVMSERAADVSSLTRADDLHQNLCNLRRRLLKTAAALQRR